MMSKSYTRIEYVSRINRVIDYIQQNLNKKLSLTELAGIAAFSPSHFHYIFHDIVGEALSQYIARLRLQYAAMHLKYQPHDSITEVAWDYGFESLSGFSRAFTRYFGLSPSQFWDHQHKEGRTEKRSNTKGRPVDGKPGKTIHFLAPYYASVKYQDFIKENIEEMKVEVKNFPRTRVVYVRVMDGYHFTTIRQAFEKIKRWAKARDLFGPENMLLGVNKDFTEVTPMNKCRYDACVTVPPGTQGDGEIGCYDIPESKYAFYRVEGQYTSRITEQAGRYWQRLKHEWLPNSGYQLNWRPGFELYLETEEEFKAGKYVMDICLSVAPL